MLVSMSCLLYGMGAVFQKEPPYDLPEFFIIKTRQCKNNDFKYTNCFWRKTFYIHTKIVYENLIFEEWIALLLWSLLNLNLHNDDDGKALFYT